MPSTATSTAPSSAEGVEEAVATPTLRRSDLRWVMTAPQLQPRHKRPRLPWGTVHLRRNGSHRTACGEPTVLWHTFWELPVNTRSAEMCSECAWQAATRSRDTDAAR
jgi:hypothetical protein